MLLSPPFFSMILLPREAFSAKKKAQNLCPWLHLLMNEIPNTKHLRYLTNQSMIPLSAAKACPKLGRPFPLSIASLIFWHPMTGIALFPHQETVGPWSQPSEGTAKEVSFEWPHHTFSSTNSKIRTSLHSIKK